MKRFLVLAGSSAVIVLAVGCASRGPPRSDLLSSWTPPPGQTCRIRDEPSTLPPVSSLVEPAALREVLRDPSGQHRGYALFSLVYDTTGVWKRVAAIESNLREADRQWLSRVLKSHLKAPPPHPRLRLRIELGDSARMAVGRSQACPPAIRNGLEISGRATAIATRYRRRTTVILRVWVNADGTPGETKVVRSSGDARLDAELRALARHMRFHPALDDRVPVAVWAQVPLYFKSSR